MHKDLIDFEKYLNTERHAASLTVRAYLTDLEQYALFCEKQLAKPNLREATPKDIRRWVMTLMETEGDTSRSVRRKLSALNAFYRYLMRDGKVQRNPAKLIILPKIAKTLPYFFQEKEMDNALKIGNNMDADTFEEARNHLMIDLFYQTGMRVSELCKVEMSDFDFSRRSLKVIGKRDKERRIPLGDDIIQTIKEYVRKRDEEVETSPRLFVRKNGKWITSNDAYKVVHDYMSQVSTLKKRSPHVLRHTFASTLLNNGADIYAVKELLGHASLAATEIYTHSSFEHLLKTYKQAHPRGS